MKSSVLFGLNSSRINKKLLLAAFLEYIVIKLKRIFVCNKKERLGSFLFLQMFQKFYLIFSGLIRT
jgi:hypothetical protein